MPEWADECNRCRVRVGNQARWLELLNEHKTPPTLSHPLPNTRRSSHILMTLFTEAAVFSSALLSMWRSARGSTLKNSVTNSGPFLRLHRVV